MSMRTATAARAAAAALCVVAVTACNEFSEGTDRASDCLALASDAAQSGLEDTPTREEAEQAVQRLEERIPNLGDQDVQEAAEMLRDRLREVREMAEQADPAEVEQAADEARQAAEDAARTCDVPVDQFVQ